MAHVRGPWLPGCLALAALLSLVHSQRGKGDLETGIGWQTGMWAHGLGFPGSTENTGPAPRWASVRDIQLRGVQCSGLDRRCLLLSCNMGSGPGVTNERRGASGLPLAAFQVLLPSQTPHLGSQQGRPGLLPVPMMAKTARLPQATVPCPSHRSVPGPSASTIAAPAGPTCQQWLPGGVTHGQPGARVRGGAVQLRGGLRGPGVFQRHGEGGPGPSDGAQL